MQGEWVMFRLKGKPGEKAEPWMLKKVTDEFAEPGRMATRWSTIIVTSVTTDRTMAEIASGSDVWRSNRGGQQGRATRKKAGAGPAAVRGAAARDPGRCGAERQRLAPRI